MRQLCKMRMTVISLLPQRMIVPRAILQKMIYDDRYCASLWEMLQFAVDVIHSRFVQTNSWMSIIHRRDDRRIF